MRGQLLAAYTELEREISRNPIDLARTPIAQAHITAAVAWQFTQSMLASTVIASDHPALRTLSAAAEQLPEFVAYPPIGPGV